MKSTGYSWNNLMAMIVIFLIIFSIWSFWWTNQSIEATSESISGEVSFCYESVKPVINFISPTANAILSGNITITTECLQGPQYVSNISFSFNKGNSFYDVGSVNDDENGLGFFIKRVNSTKEGLPDGNCDYRVYALAKFNNTCTLEGDYLLDHFFTINNHDEPPLWDNFKNNVTTNFSKFSSWVNLSDVNISDGKFGLIEFPFNTNFDSSNLDDDIKFTSGKLILSKDLICIHHDISTHPAFVELYNLSFLNPGIYVNGEKSSLATVINYINHTLYFKVITTGTFTAYEKGALAVKIFDDTDSGKQYYVHQNIDFYANLTGYFSHREFYSPNISCEIDFPSLNDSTYPRKMKYNHSRKLYYFQRKFSKPSLTSNGFDWSVDCNATSIDLGFAHDNDKVIITNRIPVKTRNMPNETWAKNSVLNGWDLDDYFVDPDNDTLSYNFTPIDNLHLYINTTMHTFIVIPETNWYGNRTTVFYASDPWGGSASSNLVYFHVINYNPPPPHSSSSHTQRPDLCEPDWVCGNWSICMPTGIKTRDCADNNHCNASYSTPITLLNCTYIPTCFDHIKNQNETGVDCGGPCLACPTCFDGLRNQGEEGIDCGGPCDPCPSCNDGILNQNEFGIDCGGPCLACPTCFDGIKNGEEEGSDCGGSCHPCEKDVIVEKPALNNAFWSIFLISLFFATSLALVLKNKIFKLFETISKFFKRILLQKSNDGEIFLSLLYDSVTILSKIGELRVTKDYPDFKLTVENFFTYLFGDFDVEKIKRDIQFSIFNSKIKEMLIEILDNIENREMDRILEMFSEVVSDIFVYESLLIGENYETVFNHCVKEVHNLRGTNFASLKKLIYSIYLKLPVEIKGKVYKSLKEIDSVNEKMAIDKGITFGLIFVIIFAFSLSFSLFYPNLTGFSVKGNENMSLILPETIQIPYNLPYQYQIVVSGGNPPYHYQVNFELINVNNNGLMTISPITETGRYQFEIKVWDKFGNSESKWLYLDVEK